MRSLISSFLQKYLGQIKAKEAFQVGTVAFTFILFNQYWRVDEHVVFILTFFATVSGSSVSGFASRVRIGSTAGLYLYFSFLLWLLFSITWSSTPHLSFSYSLLVILVGLTATMQGFLFGQRVLLRGILAGVFVIGVHVLFVGVLSGDNTSSLSGIGLYTNPSSLTFVFGIGFIAALFCLSRNPFTWVLAGLLVVFFATVLINLFIVTSFFAIAGGLFIGLVVFHLRLSALKWRKLFATGYATLIFAVVMTFWLFRGPIARLFGEDESLGERIPLWMAYFEAVLWRPWLGSGWGNTVGWDFPLSQDNLTPVYEWFPAHNGYLDIALMLGFVGLFLFLAGLLSLYWDSLNLAIEGALSWRTAFVPVLLTYLMLNDVMATSFPKLIGVFLVGSMIGSTVRMRGDLPLATRLNRSRARGVLA